MQTDIRLQYQQVLDESHHGHPSVVETVQTGRRGRPSVQIDPQFLEWAYAHRSTSGIARFLHVGRTTVRNALLEYGIADSQVNPFVNPFVNDNVDAGTTTENENATDDLLDPNLPISPISDQLLDNISVTALDATNTGLTSSHQTLSSFTGPLSTLTDDQLDDLILRLRSHYRRAGISMLDGMLRRLGHRLPRERVRASLMRIDPVQRVFQRIRIRRRVYAVPGPNSLWHHDGQHGMCFSERERSANSHIGIRPHPMGYCDPRIHRWLLASHYRLAC